ncbi:hypothetical protein ABZU25_03295 [Micromonospora sp. NPDC005215]
MAEIVVEIHVPLLATDRVPRAAFAVITDDEADAIGQGRRVELESS